MDALTRRVIARFRDDPDERAPDQDQSWMDYMKSKSDGVPPSSAAKDMLEHGTFMKSEEPIYNPYDYEDPSEKPKEPKGPPFVNEVPPQNDYGLFQLPKLFKEDGELKEWLQCQDQDFTENEQEQNPAISLTCKYATVEGVVGRYLLRNMPIEVREHELDDLFRMTRVAATLEEILDKDVHYRNDAKLQRASQVNAVWINKNNPKQRESGYFIFRATTPGSKHGPHTVYLQFLRGEGEKEYKSYADYPVLVACTCPSFLWWGAQYYAVHDNYMYLPAFKPDDIAPKVQPPPQVPGSEQYPSVSTSTGRGLNFRVCKHLLKVYELVKAIRIETVYRKYPVSGPPSKIINTDVWKDLMKFDFTEANIKQRL
jgi:hypothetical protein